METKMTMPVTGNLTANNTGLIIDGRPSGKLNLNPVFAAWGTFGGGTIKLQAGFYAPDNVTITWMDITGVTLAANGYVSVPVRTPAYRIVLSGATAPNLNYHFG